MSFPKLNECLGDGDYKRISTFHALKNSLARNTLCQSPNNVGP
jgi:hypothetical protein